MRSARALLAPLAALAFLSALGAPASASIQFDQQWGSLGILNGQFSLPNRVATDPSGNVYVTDAGNGRVEKFSTSGTFITKWGSLGAGDGQFLSEQGIAADPSGNVYVVDGQANRIQKFTSSGTFITKWGSLGSGDGQFNGPQGIATDSSSNVYVTDGTNGRIQKFDSSGTFITKWGSAGTADGQFTLPSGVATDSSGDVYVADAGNGRIQKFTSSGTFITKWGSVGTADGQFGAGTALDVATGFAGNVIVADTTNNRIEKFRPSGTFITKWGSLGSGAGQFTTPSGVATDSSDNVYVVDQSNNRIEKFHETDTSPPDTQIDSGPSGTSPADVSFAFSSAEPQLLGFECFRDSADWASCTSPKGYSSLSDGSHTFQVRAVDAAGNPDPSEATRTWTVDGTPPDTTIDSGPQGQTNDATPSFGFSASEPGSSFECRFDSDPFGPCSGPGDAHTPASALADGSHTFHVRATDGVGNTDPSPDSRSFAVDTDPPETTIDSGPQGQTNDATPSFGFSASEPGSSFECRFDSDPFGPCSGPGDTHTPASALAQGSHTFEVQATDQAGNTDPSPDSRSFTVDTVPPDTTINSGPQGQTKDATPSFGFSSEPGASFECRFDSGPFGPCSGPGNTHTAASALAEGPHTFYVRATDQAGNADPSPDSHSFTVDTVPPQTTIVSGPPSQTKNASPSFGFSASEPGSSFKCRLDSGSYSPCSSPKTYGTLPDGVHTFYVRATDSTANFDPTPAVLRFTVDTVPPNTAIITGPSGGPSSHLTVDPTPTFTFSSSQAHSSFRCKLGSSPYASCPSPWTAAHLADGNYRLYVRATDPAGNVDPTPTSLGFVLNTATVQVVGTRLVVKGATGAEDNLLITATSASTLRVTDVPGGPYRGSGVHTGAGCTRVGDYTANCNATGIRLITVNSADLNDRVVNSTALVSSLVGGGGADALIGGTANDNLTGLAGADIMKGMEGNDRLFAHDAASDKTIDCDGGTTPGATDQADLDLSPKDSAVSGCETVTRH